MAAVTIMTTGSFRDALASVLDTMPDKGVDPFTVNTHTTLAADTPLPEGMVRSEIEALYTVDDSARDILEVQRNGHRLFYVVES
jgi:hypothetical protein